jgi:hypothetical protein
VWRFEPPIRWVQGLPQRGGLAVAIFIPERQAAA